MSEPTEDTAKDGDNVYTRDDVPQLFMDFTRDPMSVVHALRADDGLLAQAIKIAWQPYRAAERLRAASVLLRMVADEMRRQSLAPLRPPGRRRPRSVKPRPKPPANAVDKEPVPF